MLKTIVLAAGKGTRLKSRTPKVLHRVFDKPILAWVLDCIAELPSEEIIVIGGYKYDEICNFLHAYPVSPVLQESQLGTGHALLCAADTLGDFDGSVLVVNGDCPLIRSETLNKLYDFHKENVLDVSMLTCELDDPTGYGRIIRKDQQIIGIKEHKDCSEAEKSITEINTGVYIFEWQKIKQALHSLSNNNAQEEYYLTDVISWAYTQGLAMGTLTTTDKHEVLGVNSREDLAKVYQLKNETSLQKLMAAGVTIVDPKSTWISPDADIAHDTIIMPNTVINRRVTIGEACTIGPNTSIYGPAEVGAHSTVIQSHIVRSTIRENCWIGPFAHLRDGADIHSNIKIGNYVEVKNSQIGDDTAVGHLSYIGDTRIKSKVNIGAGTVIANYNHATGEKFSSTIESGASTGANCVVVSPINIGKDSSIAAGSVITKDVPDGALAIARPRQENKIRSIPKH